MELKNETFIKVGGNYVLHDEQTEKQEKQGELKTVYLDGELQIRTSLDEIRTRIKENLK